MDRVVNNHKEYSHSLLKAQDGHIRQFINDKLVDGLVRPDTVLQLTPRSVAAS